MSTTANQPLLSRDEFVQRLRAVGEEGYHDKHPFHVLMHEGKLTKRQLQAWIENRFYYQVMIPKKDSVIMAKMTTPAERRAWIQRIIDHDGILAKKPAAFTNGWYWVRLLACVEKIWKALRFVLPAVRFAVDAYLTLVQTHSLVEAVGSSLTELFAPTLMSRRLPAFEEHYPWVEKRGLEYFRSRLIQAPRDVEYGLEYVVTNCTTRDLQERVVRVLTTKCHILWSLLDAVHFAYVTPGLPPPLWGK